MIQVTATAGPRSQRALWEALCSSVSVPTHTAVAGAVVTAITVLIWSPLDGTRHSDLLNRTRPRAAFEPSISTHAEHKRTVLRPTVGRHSLGSGRLPGLTGAGAGSALTWPRPAATLGPWLDPPASSIRKPYACVLPIVRHEASCRNASEWSCAVQDPRSRMPWLAPTA